MDLTIRLRLLKEGGQLSEENYQAIFKIIEMLADDWNVGVTEENGAMFVTHLAIAFERIGKGETVRPAEEFLLAELRGQAYYNYCCQALESIATIWGRAIPKAEADYILVHLCTLFAKAVQI